jgi:hypothetical protein
MTDPQIYRYPHPLLHLSHRAAMASSPEQALDLLRKQNVPSPSIRQLELWDGEKWISVKDVHATTSLSAASDHHAHAATSERGS